jgi:AcrR family transcriptional regulator
MTKLSPTAAATRQNFIDAFCVLYKTRPVEKITVAELSRKAGYNRGTFYDYFVDVYDLLEQIEDELIEQIGMKIGRTISVGNFTNLLLVAFSDMKELTEKYAFTLLTSDHISKFPEKLKNAIMPVIMAAFHIPPDNTQVVYALDFYLSGIISLMTEWQKNGRELSVDELGALVRTVLTEGVLKAIGRVGPSGRGPGHGYAAGFALRPHFFAISNAASAASTN